MRLLRGSDAHGGADAGRQAAKILLARGKIHGTLISAVPMNTTGGDANTCFAFGWQAGIGSPVYTAFDVQPTFCLGGTS